MGEKERALEIGKVVIEWQEKTKRLNDLRADVSTTKKNIDLIVSVLKEDRRGGLSKDNVFTLVDRVNGDKATEAAWPDPKTLGNLIDDIARLKGDLQNLESEMAQRGFSVKSVGGVSV